MLWNGPTYTEEIHLRSLSLVIISSPIVSMYELLLVGGILPLWIYVGLSLGD